MGKLFIGTSGWIYSHWEKVFYPENLSAKNKLKYYSSFFKTVEINYSFYHLPRSTTYQKWYCETPADFIFSVKASRFITHIKRLKRVKKPWKQFIENALYLKEKLGPILFQFPPSFQVTEENLKRLEDFLIQINHLTIKPFNNLRFAFEFRHKSWCDPEGKSSVSYGVNKKIYNLLKKYNVAWVIADSPNYPYIETLKKFRSGRSIKNGNRPKAEAVTADFVYMRMHGSKILFASKYTKKELKDLAQKIKKWLKNHDVYCYFNNDAYGYAIENAKELLRLCIFSEK
jgi:uncharacterized protein YecE (DUF72 family)